MQPYVNQFSWGPIPFSQNTGFNLYGPINVSTSYAAFGFATKGQITPSDYIASARVTLNWAALTDTNMLICNVYTSVWNSSQQQYVPNTLIQTGTYVSHINSVAGLGGNNKDVLFNLSAPAGSSDGPFFLVLSYGGVTVNDLRVAYPQNGSAFERDYVAGGNLGLNPAVSVGTSTSNGSTFTNLYTSSQWPMSLTDNSGNVLGSQILVSSFNGNGSFNLYQTRKLTQDFTVPSRIVVNGIKMTLFAQSVNNTLAPVFSITQSGSTVTNSDSYVTTPTIGAGGSDYTYLQFTSPVTLNSGLTYTLNVQSNFPNSGNSLIPVHGKKQVTNDTNFPWSFSYFNGTSTTAYPYFWLPFEFIGDGNFAPTVTIPAPQHGRTTLNI